MSDASRDRPTFGARATPEGVAFRVWAPTRSRVEVVLEQSDESTELTVDADGFFTGVAPMLCAGARYRYRLDGGETFPDPASRFQPDGVHGPSQVVDASKFPWRHNDWRGLELPGQVLYELHIGTFTPEGAYAAAATKLPHLADLGVTVLEVMPLNEFSGEFGWGYDGVFWYAPTRNYGAPDDLRRFIDAAHGAGIAVILDVVYNHFGPLGCSVSQFAPDFFSNRHPTEWGDAINFDGERSGPVREFVIANAVHWIEEYRFDGLRIDATQAIFDDSENHVLAELSAAVRAAAPDRSLILLAENESQDVRHLEPIEHGGFGLDGLWNDDFHHCCRVAATGHAEFYYADYTGAPQELISATKWNYLYQGQYAPYARRKRGTPAHAEPAWRFVHFLQNHDQLANSALGQRLHRTTSPGTYRALTTLLLLSPATPMLFMGQEFAASAPFLYFADYEAELAELVRCGRWDYLRRFPRIAGHAGEPFELHDPAIRTTFETSKLDWSEAQSHHRVMRLHRDLLAMRREDAAFASQDRSAIHGAVVNDQSFLLRWLRPDGDDRLLAVNLGRDYRWRPVAEPLMAPPDGADWRLRFSSEHQRYGGSGAAEIRCDDLIIPGHAAILLTPAPVDPPAD